MSKIFKILFMAISLLFLGTMPSAWAGVLHGMEKVMAEKGQAAVRSKEISANEETQESESDERTPPAKEKTLELEIGTSEIKHPENKKSREEIKSDVESLNNRRKHLFETQQRSHERGIRTTPPSPVALVVGVHFVDADERDPSKNPFIQDHPKAEAVTILKRVLYPNGAEYEIEIYFRNRGTKNEPMAYAEAVSEEIRHAEQISRNPGERLRNAKEEREMLEAVLKRDQSNTELIKFLERFLSKKEVEALNRNNAPLLASVDIENFRRVIAIFGYHLEKEEISRIMRHHLRDLLLIQSAPLSRAIIMLDNHLKEENLTTKILRQYWKKITRKDVLRFLQEMNLPSGESAYGQIKDMLSELKGEHPRSIPGFGAGDSALTESEGQRMLFRNRNDRGSVILPFAPLVESTFAGSLGKFTAALALKEAMKEFLTGKEGDYAHLLSSEQVVGYGSFGLVSGTGEEASRALGDAIARKTGLNAFSSRASMISPYRLGSHALFMTLGMQADQIARLWMGGIKEHKDAVTALNDAFAAWWSQFQGEEAALTTAGFLLTKPLVSKFMQAVRSGAVQRLRNLQKNIRWGHRLLSGTNRFSPWGILEEAIVLLTVDLLMEEYLEWKKESELKEKIAGIFNELSDLVDRMNKENADESAQKMGALFEDLRAVRMAYVHLEKEDVSKKYQAFQEALKDLLDHKSGMFWRDAKAIYAAREVRDSEENRACQVLFDETQKENPLKFSPEPSGKFYRNHLCQHLTFLKMWSAKLEEVKKRYYEYQMAYAKSENRKYGKYVFSYEFLKKIDLNDIGKPEVFDIRYANPMDIYQLEQTYYETALRKISERFSGIRDQKRERVHSLARFLPEEKEEEFESIFISPDMEVVFNALKEVARGAKAAEVVFETSFEQLEENKIEGDFEIDNLFLLTEILKEDKFWIELVVESRNPTGIYTTYNPHRLHVMNEINCLSADHLQISDDVFSLEGTEEKPWMSCQEYGERFSTQNEEDKRRWLGIFIHGFLNSGIQNSGIQD